MKTNIQFQAVGPIVAAEKQHDFDPRAFLATIGNVVLFPKKQTIFAQGDLADAVFCVQTGKVRLTFGEGFVRRRLVTKTNGGNFSSECHALVFLLTLPA